MNTHKKTPTVLATLAQTDTLAAVLAHVPSMDVDANKMLARSLTTHGQLSPILRRGGQIVDGRRRMNALTALGREAWIIDLPMSEEATSDAEVLGSSFFELNGCRRELTLGIRAAIADTLATLRKGANQHGGGSGVSRAEAARTMGLSADTLDRYRKIKFVDDVHAKVLAGTMSLPQAVRTVEGRAVAAKARAAVLPEGDLATCIDQLMVEGVAYSVVLADPPWNYDVKGPGTYSAAPGRHYPTMNLADIKALPVDRISAKDSVLWLWTPNCLLTNALEVMEAWGFEYVSHAVWVKRRGCPTNSAIRPTHEVLLMGRRGQGFSSNAPAMKSVFIDDQTVTMHSRKPTHFTQELERLYPNAARVELFCRNARLGWAALGNQVTAKVDAGPAANDDAAPDPSERTIGSKKAPRTKKPTKTTKTSPIRSKRESKPAARASRKEKK